jgi:hypothetical protein
MTDRAKGGKFAKGNSYARVGNGVGWGGPAKGEGNRIKSPEEAAEVQKHATDPSVLARKEEVREKVLRLYETVVDDPAQSIQFRLVAGDKLLDRIDGKAVQTNLNVNRDDLAQMTDDELRAERDRIAAARAAAGTGDVAPGDTAQPAGVVH